MLRRQAGTEREEGLMATITEGYARFVELAEEIAYLSSSLSLLEYDMQVGMPPAGAEGRSRAIAAITRLLHEKSVAPEYGSCLEDLQQAMAAGLLDPVQKANVARAWRKLENDRRLPGVFVNEMAAAIGAAHHVWVAARDAKRFADFQPALERIVALKQQEAALLQGRQASPYDALLDQFEQGATTASVAAALQPLREFLPGFIRRLAASPHAPDPRLARIDVPLGVQQKISRLAAEIVGYDLNAGRINESAHPFSATIHPGDHRITTRYDEDDFLSSFGSVIHECGHAVYEQNLPKEHFGLAAGLPSTMGIHESQSRFWEIMVGRSRAFWMHFLPVLRKLGVRFDSPDRLTGAIETFYRSCNTVRPSLIRVDADEVTYNLHILLRFEIERDLIEERLEVADLPVVWNAKMREYLGIDVPDDAVGVLQDIHWSSGYFGYFPSYALGNLNAAQLFAAAGRDIPGLERKIAVGDLAPLRAWLNEKIWCHGAVYDPAELVRRATGEPPSARAFIQYVERKYGEIYRL